MNARSAWARARADVGRGAQRTRKGNMRGGIHCCGPATKQECSARRSCALTRMPAKDRKSAERVSVNNSFQGGRGRRRSVWLAVLLLAGVVIGLRRDAAGHDLLAAYVRHSVHLVVGARHIDLTLDLTFFEEPSARERMVMDADANGHITRSELESYVRQLAPQLAEQVDLRVAGRDLPLVPLYNPEIDLLGNNKVGLARHRLRLFFFASTPTALRADTEMVVEDRLWLDTRALGTLQAEGRDGCALEPEKTSDPSFAPASGDEGRLFKVRCLKPPTAPASVADWSRTNAIGTTSKPLAH